MRYITVACMALGLSVVIPITDADAQSRSGRRAVQTGMTGALIGGLAGGGRGAAIGGLVGLGVGSVMGRQMERRRGNHYWFDGRCWVHLRNGEFHPVSRRYC